VEWLAGELNLTAKTAGRHLAHLAEHGLIVLWEEANRSAGRARVYLVVALADDATLIEANRRHAGRVALSGARNGKVAPNGVGQERVRNANGRFSRSDAVLAGSRAPSEGGVGTPVAVGVRSLINRGECSQSECNNQSETVTGRIGADAVVARQERSWVAVIDEGLALVGRAALKRGPGTGMARVFKRIEAECGARAAADALIEALTSALAGESTMSALNSAAMDYFEVSELSDARTERQPNLWCPWRWQDRTLVLVHDGSVRPLRCHAVGLAKARLRPVNRSTTSAASKIR